MKMDPEGGDRDDDLTRWVMISSSRPTLCSHGHDRSEEHVKFLVICRPRDGAPMDRFAALVPEEAEGLHRLRAQGILVEAWSPGGPGAVLIIEAPSDAEAEGVVARLPLTVAGLIDVELTPLHDLGI
jgi:muconolactone delta-isomerase